MKERYTISRPDYTIGSDAYDKIREVCPPFGKSVVVIGGRRGVEAAQDSLIKSVEGVGLEFTGFLLAEGETTWARIDRLANDHATQEADMVFAVGGGKAIDTAKAVASRLHKPVFTFPTVAGSCAAAARISTIYNEDGSFAEFYFLHRPPVHVFLCTRIILQAPESFLLRGIADTMAKYYEAQIAARGKKLLHKDGIALALSKMCSEPLYEYAEQAVADNRSHTRSTAFEETVLAVVVTSAMVSNYASPEYNGHMANALFSELAALPESERCAHHGGLAAYGVLLLLLADGQEEEFKRFYDFCSRLGLATCREGTGASEARVQKVFRATEKKQDVRILPYKITQTMLHEASEKLEAYHAEQEGAAGKKKHVKK